MSFFGLSDIKINLPSKQDFGPLRALEGTPFAKTTLKYPVDIGSADKGHYMVFFAKEQTGTDFPVSSRGGTQISAASLGKAQAENIKNALDKGVSTDFNVSSKLPTSFGGAINKGLTDAINKGTSAIGSLGSIPGIPSGVGNLVSKGSKIANRFLLGPQLSSNFESLNRDKQDSINRISDKSINDALNKTSMTTDSIALYMPDTLAFTDNQNFNQLTPGNELGGQLINTLQNVLKNPGEATAETILKSGASQKFATELAGRLTGQQSAALLAFAATGRVVNPMLEVLYTSPSLRNFDFSFIFYPRDENEAGEVQRIIERFRFHMMPELATVSGNQNGLITPPSEFDIRFYYAGRENPNIQPIATCVLKTIDVDYAPNGFAAYETLGENNPHLGRTGMPTSITIRLSFTEKDFITKSDFGNRFGSKGSVTPIPAFPGVNQVVQLG